MSKPHPSNSALHVIAVMVNYNTAEMTLRAAESCVNELQRTGYQWSLIIVDNRSEETDIETLRDGIKQNRQYEGVNWQKVIDIYSTVNNGFGAGNNIAFEYCRSNSIAPDYFFLINSDAFPEQGSISNLIKELESDQRAGIAGSYIHGSENDPHYTAFRFPSVLGELETSARIGIISKALKKYVVSVGLPEETTEVDWLAGASMMIKKKALDDIGEFDEAFFLYYEETDLCKRALSKEWKTIYVPESSVSHIGSASTGMRNWQRIPSYWLESRRYYFIKHHGMLGFSLATILRLIGESLCKTKAAIERKPYHMPAFFISDLFKDYMVFLKLRLFRS